MSTTALQHEIETTLGACEPEVEVLLVEQIGASTLRITIDHPEGVSLGLCERVTRALADLRERFALEVSSPGRERPLTKPDHFRRFKGRSVRVRTREPRDGHRSFMGRLVGATEREVTIAAEAGVIAIPYDDIHRSNLVEE
jgi:ribosome maturation factor RimP